MMRAIAISDTARVVSGTRKFDRGLTQLQHADLHWLDVPERFRYKLCLTMRRCQDGTAPQYLAVHWAPVSETTSRRHLRSDSDSDSDSDLLNIVARRLKIKNTNSDNNTTQQYKKNQFNAMQCHAA